MGPLAAEDSVTLHESPVVEQGRNGASGVTPGCLVAVAMMALGAILVLLGPRLIGDGDGRVEVGRVTDYEPGTVVYWSTDRLFVVRLLGGEVIALSDLDPHNPPGRRSCRVSFRPDLAVTTEDGRGVFFDACTGSLYDLEGRGLAGDGFDLLRLPVDQDDAGRLTVRPGEPPGE